MRHQFDDVLVQSFRFPGDGRQLLPPRAPLYNKFARVVPIVGLGGLRNPVRLRYNRVGTPAIAHRLHVGEFVRYEIRTFVHNLEGRK